MDLDSFSSRIKIWLFKIRQGMEENFTRSDASKNENGLFPASPSEEEREHICFCFQRANLKVEGYLDFHELMTYTNLRGCPITGWEAEKILEYADPASHRFITLDQVMDLATYLGIGTDAQKHLRWKRSEFEAAIKNVFQRLSQQSEPASPPLHRNSSTARTVQKYSDFEGFANLCNCPKSNVEEVFKNRIEILETQFQAISSNFQHFAALSPPKESISIDEKPLLSVKEIVEKFEPKIQIQNLMENKEADDFFVTLTKQPQTSTTGLRQHFCNYKSNRKEHTDTEDKKSFLPKFPTISMDGLRKLKEKERWRSLFHQYRNRAQSFLNDIRKKEQKSPLRKE